MRRWRIVVAPTLSASGDCDSKRMVCRIIRAGRTVALSGLGNDASTLLRTARAELRSARKARLSDV